MRLKQFIITEKRSESISKYDALDAINSKCKDALKEYRKGNIIYRGIENHDPFLKVSPSKFTRVSKGISNYYTLINDNSPAWEKYPKRSKSIICANNYDLAYSFGKVYIVFPFDGAKIGVCSTNDYWSAFPFLRSKLYIDSIKNFNDYIENLFNIRIVYKNVGDINKVKTYKDLQKLFHEFDKFVKEQDKKTIAEMKRRDENRGFEFKEPDYSPTINYFNKKTYSLLLRYYEKFNDLEKYFRYLLDPKKNKFELKTIGDKLPKNKEVWTDSDSILVHHKIANEILP